MVEHTCTWGDPKVERTKVAGLGTAVGGAGEGGIKAERVCAGGTSGGGGHAGPSEQGILHLADGRGGPPVGGGVEGGRFRTLWEVGSLSG